MFNIDEFDRSQIHDLVEAIHLTPCYPSSAICEKTPAVYAWRAVLEVLASDLKHGNLTPAEYEAILKGFSDDATKLLVHA
jgi:RecG-like helicase